MKILRVNPNFSATRSCCGSVIDRGILGLHNTNWWRLCRSEIQVSLGGLKLASGRRCNGSCGDCSSNEDERLLSIRGRPSSSLSATTPPDTEGGSDKSGSGDMDGVLHAMCSGVGASRYLVRKAGSCRTFLLMYRCTSWKLHGLPRILKSEFFWHACR